MDTTPAPTPVPTPPEQQPNTPQPIYEPSNTTQPPLPPKKRSKTPLIIVIVLLLLLAVGAAAYYFLFMNKTADQTDSQATTTTTTTKEEVKASMAETLVAKIKDSLKAELVTTTKSDVDGGGEEPGGTVVYYIPSYQPSGYDYSVAADGYGVAVSSATADKTIIDTDYDTAVTMLEKEDLKLLKGSDYSNTSEKNALYHNDNLVCNVHTWYSLRGSNYTGVGCADMSKYIAAAKVAAPFHEAYLAANPEIKKTMAEFPPYYGKQTTNEGAAGYKNIEVLMNNFAGLYYQAPNSKTPKFFMGVQNIMPCDKYNTDELKNAFAGRPCTDPVTNKDTVVKAA